MCLIAFSWQPDSETPLTMVANRDEFYQRPTLPVHFWEDSSHILGGKDLEAGGSWLAFSRKGRFAALTNYRELPIPTGKKSRGDLVRNFLTDDISPTDYLTSIAQSKNNYAGFNLLIGTRRELFYYSNKLPDNQFKMLSSGVYGLCNHLLDTPWPKLMSARNRLTTLLQKKAEPEQLIEMMHDNTQAKEELLPDTGIGLESEKLLSSCFIASDNYGTRNTSIIQFDQSGYLCWTEQNYHSKGFSGERQFFETTFG